MIGWTIIWRKVLLYAVVFTSTYTQNNQKRLLRRSLFSYTGCIGKSWRRDRAGRLYLEEMSMKNFIFENGTKVLFGEGCVREYLASLLKGYGDTIMVAYGGGSIKRNGIYEEVMEILKTAGKQVVEFSGIMPNPTYEKVLKGAKLAKENQVDMILGVGEVL